MVDKLEIIRLRKHGFTQEAIAKHLGCHRTTVFRTLREFNVAKPAISAEERLNAKLKKNAATGCWEYQGGDGNRGYGQIRINGIKYRAHRVAYSLFVGEIPEGMNVCHKCDNPSCCNPDHLFVGDAAANVADKVRKGRQARGAGLPQTKASPDVLHKCLELKLSGMSNRQIAVVLGLHRTTVENWLKEFGDRSKYVAFLLTRKNLQKEETEDV